MVRFKVFGLLILALMVGVLVMTSFALGATTQTFQCCGNVENCCSSNTFNTGLTCQANRCKPVALPQEPSNYNCWISSANQCSGANTIMNLSGTTNAHGYLVSNSAGAGYKLCCNFPGGSSSLHTCDGTKSNAVMYLSTTGNAHAEEVKYDTRCTVNPIATIMTCSSHTTQLECAKYGCTWNGGFFGWGSSCSGTASACSSVTNDTVCQSRNDCRLTLIPGTQVYSNAVCFSKGMKCIGVNSPSMTSCDETPLSGTVYNIEVASISSETNAHIGNFSDYPVKICCSEFCEMYKQNSSCWSEPSLKCTWWPPGTATIAEGAGCCDEGSKWKESTHTCSSTGGECYLIWDLLNQKEGQSTFNSTNPDLKPWDFYCAKLNPGINYGEKNTVQRY
ncbi:Uncharacterised protein [uncultured archaeon]|nr:Uncharacterised protein [uncultured archaeon]